MSTARFSREQQRQLGQFFTPAAVAASIVASLPSLSGLRVLEPSFGRGAFLDALLGRARTQKEPCEIWGCELDPALYQEYLAGVGAPAKVARLHLVNTDYFRWMPDGSEPVFDRRAYFARDWGGFDLIIGNPPFGGSIDPMLQDPLDAIYGLREGLKIKKETYSFFVVKSLDLLKAGGRLRFICSDTFLTINTMRGLRHYLMEQGSTEVSELPGLFDSTQHPMVLLDFVKDPARRRQVTVLGRSLPHSAIERTGNSSFYLPSDLAGYFQGPTVGDYMVATSGMTIGKNEVFLRPLVKGRLIEPLEFEFFDDPITVEKERARARLNQLGPRQARDILVQEESGATRRNLRWRERARPMVVELPDPDYRYYNKANRRLLHAEPDWAIYWANEGEAVLTFKRNGNWYLHGVGGKSYFGRRGLTWSLVASRMHSKVLPPGRILDSGAPCAFLRPGIPAGELNFILGWSLTRLFNRILKEVINHTRNIQGKDFERMPYPVWVTPELRLEASRRVASLLRMARAGREFDFESPEVLALDPLYSLPEQAACSVTGPTLKGRTARSRR